MIKTFYLYFDVLPSHFLSAQVSDLLREQFFLQSEIGYDGRGYHGRGPSSVPSTRSPSPVRREEDDSKQRQGVYRASINITPAPPGRPNVQTELVAEEEAQRDGEEVEEEKGREGDEAQEREGDFGKYRAENFQKLIREVKGQLFNVYEINNLNTCIFYGIVR